MLSLPLTNMQLRPWRWWQQDCAWAILVSGACQRCKPRTAELLSQKFLVSSNVRDIKPSHILTVFDSVLCIYTMNKLYNILKIAPLKSCRGHFISASWICQPQLILRTAHVRMPPDLAVRNTHACPTNWSQKSLLSLLNSQEQSQVLQL